ncbi:MAG: site-specific DNA-methyltransferase [Clostridium botulinum]|nr:site-specific DNA-methyltransferase [Clostridium botulinum]
MQKKGKLELTWVGKNEEQKIEPRILVEDKSRSYGDKDTENMLIHGDNLIALKSLEQDFAGKIKCIYIDPPYNTGSAFEHYYDGLEHSIWLNLMKARLEILWNLLDDELGSLWISIDDSEMPYLRVLLDEICGRDKFIACNVWQKRYSRENREAIGDVHEYIIVYAKSPKAFKANRNMIPPNEKQKKVYKNPNNDPRGPWRPIPMTAQAGHATKEQFYEIVTPSGKVYIPPEGRCWSLSKATFEKLLDEGRIYFGKKGDAQPNVIRYLSEVPGFVPWTWWPNEEVGHTDEAKKEIHALFGKSNAFETPKPERLISRIIHIASNPGDIVLDSFLGTGTTAAVAHKMSRRWIGIELGNHCYTHCLTRLKLVVDGDQGGISQEVNWQGGSGFKFYELAETLLVKNEKLPIYQINPKYTFEMIVEAICKIEGFKYKPKGEFHGKSSENRFIHVTKEFVNTKYVVGITKNLGDKQSLLIYCTKMQSNMNLYSNIEIKKIPKDLLEKCSFESGVK